MSRLSGLLLAVALCYLFGVRVHVDATPLPIPMPLALVAPDFTNRWLAHNYTSFNLTRDLFPSSDSAHGHSSGHSHSDVYGESSSLSPRQYADKFAKLYGHYAAARESSSNLRMLFASTSGRSLLITLPSQGDMRLSLRQSGRTI